MRATRPKLVIVPGIGDDSRIYYSFARRWDRLGYNTQVVSFRWANREADFRSSMDAFLEQLNALGEGPIYIIGISAGGTAAVNALAIQPQVSKVITICAPLETMHNLQNPLLAASIAKAKAHVAAFTPEQKRCILSVHALYDGVVARHLSITPGVPHRQLASIGHALTVFLAMTWYARSLRGFFKK